MSFAALKKNAQSSLSSLASKMGQEKTGGNSFGPDERIWSPEVDKSGNGYAVIRFLPAPENHDMPYIKLYNHGFKNAGGKWFIENCPTTIGGDCPVCDFNNLEWSTGDKEKQAGVRQRKRQLSYYANILVISDPKHPENEGQVFLFRFGKKIFEKITQAIEPEFEDETPINPFDFWAGANFKLKIRNVEGYRNYDKSEFEAKSELFDGDDAALEALWKSEHNLSDFIAPSQFKSASEMKTKFDTIMGNAPANAAIQRSAAQNENSNEDDDFASMRSSAPAPTRSAKPDEDDDMAAYSALLED